MIGEACLFARGGLVKNKRPLCHGLGTFFPTVVEKKGGWLREREDEKRLGAMRLVDKGRKGNPGWLLTTIV